MPLKIGQLKPTNVVLAHPPHYKHMFTLRHDLLHLQASASRRHPTRHRQTAVYNNTCVPDYLN